MTGAKRKPSPLGWKDNCLKVCPRCGSIDILSNTLTGYITQPIYVCNRCGYQNTIFPEVDVDTLKKGSVERTSDELDELEGSGEFDDAKKETSDENKEG